MRALVYTGPKDLAFTDAPAPRPGDGEVTVDVKAVGICGSDMHAYLGHDERRPAPLILGHEAVGVIADGSGAGRRVVINPLVSCGVCEDCMGGRANLCAKRQIISMPPRQGAFAEQITIPEGNLIDIPESLDMDKAVVAEPLATAWHGVVIADRHSVRPISESKALVFGSGAVGLGAALALRAFGCKDVTVAETNPLRRRTAMNAGFEKVIDPVSDGALEAGFADVVLDAVGIKPTRTGAVHAARPGGIIVHIGLGDGADGFDARRLTLQEIGFFGAYTYTMSDFRATLRAMASGALGPLDWTECRPLADGATAFADLLDQKTEAAKIVLYP